jgi:hypothetical protein
MDPRLDTGGWLALPTTHYCIATRPGLSPGKRRQALLGATTLTAARAKLRPRAKRRPQFGVGLADSLGHEGIDPSALYTLAPSTKVISELRYFRYELKKGRGNI